MFTARTRFAGLVVAALLVCGVLGCRKTMTSQYENGRTSEKYQYSRLKTGEEVKDGKYTSFYDNGQVQFQATYDKGVLTGSALRYHPNGLKMVECTYRDDKPSGTYLEWYANGNKKMECTYVDSLLQGRLTTWHEDGGKHQEAMYTGGKMDGDYLYNSDIKQLTVHVNSVNARAQLVASAAYMSDLLNPSITNPKAYIDKPRGHLVITFDYPSQSWLWPGAEVGRLSFFPSPLLIRLFDNQNQYVTHFETREQWIPSSFTAKLKKYNYAWGGGRYKIHQLAAADNRLVYKLSAKSIDYASSVELGFSMYKRSVPRTILRKPPYLSPAEEKAFAKNHDYLR